MEKKSSAIYGFYLGSFYISQKTKINTMKKIIPFLLLTLIWSCGNGDTGSKIAQLETEHDKTPTSEVKKKLLAAYEAELPTVTDAETFSKLANKMATIQLDLNQYQEASQTLTKAITDHATGSSTTNNLRLLSSVLVNQLHTDNIGNAVAAMTNIYKEPAQLKSTFTPILTNLAETWMDEKTSQWDRDKIRDFISMSRIYGAAVPNDDEAQKSLFDAANMAIALKKHNQALQIYDYILANPDNFSKAPTALFLKGFTYDEHLKNIDEARKYYTQFLEKYPNDGYASSVKASLKNLGKSAAEIIESFGK